MRKIVETKVFNKKSYERARSIIPRQEAFRLLVWLWVVASEVSYKAEALSATTQI